MERGKSPMHKTGFFGAQGRHRRGRRAQEANANEHDEKREILTSLRKSECPLVAVVCGAWILFGVHLWQCIMSKAKVLILLYAMLSTVVNTCLNCNGLESRIGSKDDGVNMEII
eukprot:scaffold39630_cov74-Cyclotella_meneghiniana.AAC.4